MRKKICIALMAAFTVLLGVSNYFIIDHYGETEHQEQMCIRDRKYGVDTQNFAIDRIPDELKNKEPKDIKAELGKTQKAFKEITARVSDELYRQRAERSKEQER